MNEYRSSCLPVGSVSSCPCRAWCWAGDRGSGLIGASNAEGGNTTRTGIGGGSGVEVELYQLSGGDPEVASFILENCEYLGATISSSLELSALINDPISSLHIL